MFDDDVPQGYCAACGRYVIGRVEDYGFAFDGPSGKGYQQELRLVSPCCEAELSEYPNECCGGQSYD